MLRSVTASRRSARQSKFLSVSKAGQVEPRQSGPVAFPPGLVRQAVASSGRYSIWFVPASTGKDCERAAVEALLVTSRTCHVCRRSRSVLRDGT